MREILGEATAPTSSQPPGCVPRIPPRSLAVSSDSCALAAEGSGLGRIQPYVFSWEDVLGAGIWESLLLNPLFWLSSCRCIFIFFPSQIPLPFS